MNKEEMDKAYDPNVHQVLNVNPSEVLRKRLHSSRALREKTALVSKKKVLNATPVSSTAAEGTMDSHDEDYSPEAFIEIDSEHDLEDIEAVNGSLGSARRRRRRSKSKSKS